MVLGNSCCEKLAKNIGLPAAVVEKPKKAVQYSTGVNAVLGKIAKRHGCTINEYLKNLFAEQKRKLSGKENTDAMVYGEPVAVSYSIT